MDSCITIKVATVTPGRPSGIHADRAWTLDADSAAVLRRRARGGDLEVKLGWFHRYPARFAPDVLTTMFSGVLSRLEDPVGVILDPFAGTGATLAAARQLGLASIGVELSSLGVEVAQLRLDPPPDITAAFEMVVGWSEAPAPVRHNLDEELTNWLGDDNARAFTGYLRALANICDVRKARFGRIAVSQALRPSSRWLSGSVKVTADPKRVPPPIGMHLRRWARVIAADCRAERLASAPGLIVVGDARQLPLAGSSVDAVITSPPYFVTYDYFEVNRLSYLAFGWPRPRHLQVGMRFGHQRDGAEFIPPTALARWYSEDFSGEAGLFGRALRAYCQQMTAHFAEVRRVVRPGGIVAYAVANSTRRRRTFDLVGGTVELMLEAGFVDVEISARNMGDTRILPAARDTVTGRFASAGSAGINERVIYARNP
jgi:SAM-dependent methyltransferase